MKPQIKNIYKDYDFWCLKVGMYIFPMEFLGWANINNNEELLNYLKQK